MSEDLRRTSLYETHKSLGGRLVPFAGWEMPVQYAGVVAEHKTVRSAAGLFDVSHMGELELSGEYAAQVVDYLVTGDVKNLEVGRALYTLCCDKSGAILDDLIVYRRATERLLVVCNASNRDKISVHFRKAAEHHCAFEDASDRTALIALQGPASEQVLRRAGAAEGTLRLTKNQLRDDAIGGVSVTLARTGYTGEDGFEIFCAWQDAPAVWKHLSEAGAPLGIAPIGLGARDTLRLEARLSLYGNEIDETTNPFEAGLGWVVKLDKGDFIGREALVAIREKGPTRKLVGFEMVGRGIARHGYPIVSSESGQSAENAQQIGHEIGVVTSGSPGPTVGKNIGLGYVPLAYAEIGSRLFVKIRDQIVEAVVVKTPFYKRS